jgi:hypothetical protein
VRLCRPRPPTVRFASIAGILLRCRVLPVRANSRHSPRLLNYLVGVG